MQLSELLTPKVIIRRNSDNSQSIIGLSMPGFGYNIQDHVRIMVDGDCVPLQPLWYNTGHGNNAADGDGDYDDGYHIATRELRNNDKNIISLLNEEMGSTYSFKALERKLDIHQQSLTRALKRLVQSDLVEKTPNGYRITKNKNAFLPDTTQENSPLVEDEEKEEALTAKPKLTEEPKKKGKRFSQLIQISIPIRSNTEQMINKLVGKWFGNLRWFGLVKKETGVTLQWISINKYNNKNRSFQINVNIVSVYVVIECNAVSDKEKVEAMSCSNRIVWEITKTLQNNLEEECEIEGEFAKPKDYVPTYVNKVNHNYKKNN